MSEVTCPACGASNVAGEPFCACGAELLYEVRAAAAEPPHGGPGTGQDADSPSAPAACPACGAEVPDPNNSFCVECLEELRPAPVRPAPPGGFRLRFATGVIGVPPGGTVLLGRGSVDPAVTAVLGPLDNVSRHHAVIRVDGTGAVFVRDERSRNGTFVNDVRVAPGAELPLTDGDILRLASDVTAGVERASGQQR